MLIMSHFQRIMTDGGPIMYLIFACSVIVVFLILERVFHLHRAQLDVEEFLHGLFNVLRRDNTNTVEAIAICDETPGPVAHVLRTAIVRSDQDEAALRRAVEEAALAEVPRLERNLKIIATIAHIAPLLGLLGTVLGMIGAFDAMQEGGPFVGTIVLAKHVKQALLTTAAGLSVAIPAYAFHNFLVGRVEAIILEMEKAANEMIYFLTHNRAALEAAATSRLTETAETDAADLATATAEEADAASDAEPGADAATQDADGGVVRERLGPAFTLK